MSTWVISDIHGCYAELQELLDKISLGSGDELWCLGDYCDRGPDTVSVLEWAINAPDNHHFLLGNHDDMMAGIVISDPEFMRMRMDTAWGLNGGWETREQLGERTDPEWRRDVLIPWLEERPLFAHLNASGEEWTLVHAGFDPAPWSEYGTLGFWTDRNYGRYTRQGMVDVGEGFGEQHAQDLLWARFGWLLNSEPAPRKTVHGHTQLTALGEEFYEALEQKGLEYEGGIGPQMLRVLNRYNIDCGCQYGGKLCAMRLDDGELLYVKSRQPAV